MHKFYSTIVVLMLALCSYAQPDGNTEPTDTANYPHWMSMMQDQSINFYQTQRAFNLYWENRAITRGCGYKPFKRWESFWQTRVSESGEFPPADRNIIEYQQFLGASTQGPLSSTTGNWTELGPIALPTNGTGQPNGLGRVNCVAYHPTNANIMYIGAPSGGLWKTTNGGTTWANLTDNLPSLGVSSILIDPNNVNTIYMGTGDRDGGDAVGIGVYKSIDGGINWTASNTGMGNKTVGMMIMHPTNSSLILAATSTGIYKTINAGSTWTLVSSNSSHYRDIAFKPGDPTTVYATVNNYFYKSTNTGTSWTNITSGLPTSGRFVIGVSANNANYVYIAAGTSSGFVGLYRSTNSGATFTQMSSSPNILGYSSTGSDNSSQAYYDLCIAVDPSSVNTIYVGGINIWKSTNGGTSWAINAHWVGTGAPAVHADQHHLSFSPVNNRLYNGNDGGLYYTANGGSSWIDISSGLNIAQIYKMGQSASSKNLVINGYQDNGTAIYKYGTWNTEIGGDGMECIIDPNDTNYIYGALYYGDIRRSTNYGINFSAIADNGVNGINESGAWVTPYILNSANSNIMYIGYKNVWRSTNVKASSASSVAWTKISTFGTTSNLTDIESSPADANILYVSRGSALFRTDNANATTPSWTTLSAPASITDIKAHPTNSNIVYITAGTNIYKSTNKGSTWTSIKANLPTVSMNALVYNKNSSEGIYVGTDIGVYYKDSSMTSWLSFSTGLPVAAEITELDIYYGSSALRSVLRASTYGRGLWSSSLYSNPNSPPVADFNATLNSPCQGQYISFTDLSTNSPTSWQWSFSPSTISYATGSTANSQNPTVKFNTAGNYTVTLIATNSFGSDTISKTNYISVGTPNTAPFTENFEGFTVINGSPGTFVNGWTFSNTGAFYWRANNGTTPSTLTGPSYDHTLGTTSGKYLYTEASSPAVAGEVSNLISPCIFIPASTNYQLSFWYHMYGVDITGLHVDIFHNGAWINDIYTINGPQQTSNNSSWNNATLSLASYAGNTVQIRFRVIRGASYDGDVAIDDITIGPPPVPVTNFTASTTNTYVGIPISFADLTLNTPSSWSWSFSPSTITYLNSTSATSQNPQVTFNTGGTYSVTLITSNSNGSDTLTKTNYITVSSGYSLPFSENFQTSTPGTPGSLSNGWTTVVSGNYPWTVDTGGTPSLYTGPLVDHTLGTASGIYLFTEATSAGTGSETHLVSPVINLTNVTNAELKFWYHMYGAGISALNVDIYTTTWTNIYTITGQQQTTQSAPWLQASVNLQSYVGTSVKIRFRTISNGDYRNDISVDDILVQQVVPPTNDNPCGATSLTVNSSCSYNTYSNLNSTNTQGVPNPPCGGYTGNDVWFKFIAPASGFAEIDADPVTGSFPDGAMAVYKGSCSSLVYLDCNDDYNGSGNMPHLSLSGLNSGDTIFIRFWKYGGNGTGNFKLCIYEPPYIIISPVTKNVSSTLGSTTFQVTSNQTWTASDNVGWATVSPTSGTGNATLTVNYSANASAPRSATITVTNGTGITKTAVMTQYSNVVADFSLSSAYLCKNNPTVFTNTSVNNITNIWYVDGTSVSTNSNLSHTFTTAGTHVVKLKVSNGTNTDSISKVLYVSNPPVANAGADTTLCAGGNINLNGAVALGITNCFSNCNIPTYCASHSANDNLEYIQKVELNGSENLSSNAGVGYEDNSNYLFSVLTIDSSANLYVTGYIPGATAYTEYAEAFIDWNRNGLFDEPSIYMGSANFNGTHIFTGIVTVPSTASPGKTKMRVIMKYGAQIISGCEDNYGYGETEDYMIEVVGIGQTSYSWTGPNSYSAASRISTVTNAQSINAGVYTYTVTDGFGCSDNDTKTVNINPIPTVSFAALNNVCVNSSNITLNQGSPSGGTYFGTGINGGVFYPSTAGIGTHTLYYAYTNSSGCGDTAFQTITVNSLPIVNLSTPTSACNNAGSILLNGGSPTGGTYSGTGVSGGYFNPITAGTGSKTITYNYTDGNGCSNSAQSTITVNSSTNTTLSNIGNKCLNGGNSILVGGLPLGGTYSGTGISNGMFNPGVAGLGSHAVSYIYTNSNSCSDTAYSTITVVNPPNVSLSNFASVCAQSTPVTLTGGSPTGGSYFGTGVSSGQFNPSIGAGTYSINYTVTDANNCSDTATSSLVVNPLPTVSIIGLQSSICANNNPIQLTGSPAGGQFSGTGVIGSQFNPTTAGVGNHQISYSYTDANSCTNSISQSISVKSVPSVNAGTDATVNYSTTAQLSGTITGGGNYSHIWSPASKVVSPTLLSTQTVSMNATQIFTLLASDLSTSCSDSDQVIIFVTGGPLSLNLSASNNQVCQGDSLTLTALGGGGTSNYNYSWSFAGTIIGNQSILDFTPQSSGFYKIILNDGVTIISDSIYITVNPIPSVSIGGLQSICEGSASISLYGGVPSGGTYSGAGVSNNSFNPLVAGVGSHQIIYTVTNANNCSNSASAQIIVNAKPNAVISAMNPICETAPSFSLTSGSPIGGIYYGTGISNNNFSAVSAGIGSHTISYVYTNSNLCSDTATGVLQVQSNPTANAGLDQTVLYNNSANLSGSATGGSSNYTYSWSPSSMVLNSGSQNTSTLALIISTEFTLYVSDSQTSCSDSDKVLVVVSGGMLSANVNTSNTSICSGDSVQLTMIASGGTGIYTYSWTSIPSGFTSNIYNPIFTPTSNTDFIISVNDGNTVVQDTVSIIVSPVPNINLGADTLVCSGGNYTLDAGSGYSSYLWSDNSTNQQLNINISMLTPGLHTYFVKVSNAGNCSDSDTINILKDNIPYVNLGLDDTICRLSNKTLDAGYGFKRYLWSTGDTNQIVIIDGTAMGVGSHPVWVKVTTAYGCTNTDTMMLEIENCQSITEISDDYNISIFPNPSNGMFIIRFETDHSEKVQIEILSLQGALIKTEEVFVSSPNFEHQIDMSSKSKGVYLIRLRSENLLRIERIVIQ